MKFKFYTKTEAVWDAMLEAIAGAKRSVYMEAYILENDTEERYDFFRKLEKKAKEGVKIKVIADSFGSSELKTDAVNGLRESGVEFLYFNHLFRSTHRKILIIDERVVFTGGVNIGKFFKKWHDLQVRFTGKTIVKKILSSFARIYYDCGGHDPEVLGFRKISFARKGKVRLLEHWAGSESFEFKRFYLKNITDARESISLVTPSFIPHRWMREALRNAVSRGVNVEIILPKNAINPSIANLPNYRYMAKLHPYGIKFYLTSEMIHSKTMLVDKRFGVIGSQNLDIFSFDLNIEVGVCSEDPKFISELLETISSWKKMAVSFDPKMKSNNYLDYPVDLWVGFMCFTFRILNNLDRCYRFVFISPKK